MTNYATPDFLIPFVPGTYQVLPPEPSTRELLDRLAVRLLADPGPFDYAWAMARHRCYAQVEFLLSRAKVAERLAPNPSAEWDRRAQQAARRLSAVPCGAYRARLSTITQAITATRPA